MSALFGENLNLWRVRTDREGEGCASADTLRTIKGGQFLRFCADIFYERPLSTHNLKTNINLLFYKCKLRKRHRYDSSSFKFDHFLPLPGYDPK